MPAGKVVDPSPERKALKPRTANAAVVSKFLDDVQIVACDEEHWSWSHEGDGSPLHKTGSASEGLLGCFPSSQTYGCDRPHGAAATPIIAA